MTAMEQLPDDVLILPADKALKNKLGDLNLDELFSPDIIQVAERVISSASLDLYSECIKESAKLHFLVSEFGIAGNDNPPDLKKIISVAFALKTKAGQLGYDLVAELAKLLHTGCEEVSEEKVTAAAHKIIRWYAQSIAQLLYAKVEGDGGEIGKEILSEAEGINLPIAG